MSASIEHKGSKEILINSNLAAIYYLKAKMEGIWMESIERKVKIYLKLYMRIWKL